jgi:hypothetical protein
MLSTEFVLEEETERNLYVKEKSLENQPTKVLSTSNPQEISKYLLKQKLERDALT